MLPVVTPVVENSDDTGPSSIGWSQASPGYDGGVKIGPDTQTPLHSLNTAEGTPNVGVGTLTNLPTNCSNNPHGYIRIKINGTEAYIPYWVPSA